MAMLNQNGVEFIKAIITVPYYDCDPHFLPQKLCRPSGNIYLIEMDTLHRELNKIAKLFGLILFTETRHVLVSSENDKWARYNAINDLSQEALHSFWSWELGQCK